jgi:hypothetical protein
MATTALPGVRALPPSAGRATLPRSPVPAVVGGAGCAAVLLSSAWLAVTAAAGPSQLSPPTRRPGGDVGWLLGPLHGVLAWPVGSVADLHRWLLVATAVATGGWILAWAGAPALGTRVVLCVSGAAQALLLLGPPQPLTDVFNYVLYGRMDALYGLDPYRVAPRLALGDPVYGLANWHGLRSPYGPLFTLAFAGLGHLPPAADLWTWKVVVGVSSVATVVLTASMARRLGRNPARAAALLGLSPVLVLAEVGGEHQDAPALLCIVAAAWCLVRGRGAVSSARLDAAAGALVVLAAAIKPSLAIVAPIVVLGATRRSWTLAGLAGAGFVAGLADLAAFGGALPDLGTQASLVTPLSLPNLLGLAGGHGGADPAVRGAARAVLEGVVVLASVGVLLRRDRALPAMAVVLVAAVLALPWVMPWYLVWALPFLALARARIGAPVAIVVAVWLIVGGLPQETAVLHWAGYVPTHHATGRANHQRVENLLR